MASAEGEPPEEKIKVRLIRHDLNAYGIQDKAIEKGTQLEISGEVSRESFIKDNLLPTDSILKVKANGSYIPWSLIPLCCADEVEIQVLRPHQNIKPQGYKFVESQDTFREAVSALETRVAVLEEAAKPEVMQAKDDAEVEALTKQVEFLQRRLDEADKAEWLRDGDAPSTSTACATSSTP